jgi:hypothetical protein
MAGRKKESMKGSKKDGKRDIMKEQDKEIKTIPLKLPLIINFISLVPCYMAEQHTVVKQHKKQAGKTYTVVYYYGKNFVMRQ